MRALVGMLLAALVAGCGSSGPGPADPGNEDARQLAALVEQLNDDAGRERQLRQMFAASAARPSPKALQQFRYDLRGAPRVSGADATATVAVEKQAGGDPVEKEWTFVKEGDKWKIKSAPLP